MAQPATNPKIEELRFKLKTDPKSRLFYQLAEELRKGAQFAEAEQVLRSGLSVHPTYLAAWVSLGRVLREQKNDGAAIEALQKALQLDPGNVVAARILGDAHLSLGDKVEAIKKYKLVHALHPADEELSEIIAQLDHELSRPAVSAELRQEPPPSPAPVPAPAPAAEAAAATPPPETRIPEAPPPPPPAVASEAASSPAPAEAAAEPEESPFDRTIPPFAEASRALAEEFRLEQETGDSEPMSVAHEESPFEEPVSGFTSAAVDIEAPGGFSVAAAPLPAEVPAPVIEDLPPLDAAPVFDSPAPAAQDESADAANTATMADLYVRQGLVEDARHIYESILARDPGNDEVREKLRALEPRANRKVAQLERWLAKVTRREVGRV